jgi:hypothetical protein
MSKTVIALFDSMGRAQRAVQALERTGFVSERLQVQTGEELVARARTMDHQPEGARSGIERFFEDIGLAAEAATGDERGGPALSPDDAVVVLQTRDDRADQAAEILDRHGAVNVEERKRRTETRGEKAPSELDTTFGGTPPHRHEVEKYDDIDERALATGSGIGTDNAGRAGQHAPRHARIYAGGHAP